MEKGLAPLSTTLPGQFLNLTFANLTFLSFDQRPERQNIENRKERIFKKPKVNEMNIQSYSAFWFSAYIKQKKGDVLN